MTLHHFSLKWTEKQAQKNRMKLSERGGEVVAIVIIGLVALFFYAHETQATGFFTSSFGVVEKILLYGSILFGVSGPFARLATGRRNTARPPEMLVSLFWTVSSAWLLMVFPFNFAHFADIVPQLLRFLVIWITNDIALIIITIGISGCIISIAVNAMLYIKIRILLESDNRVQ